MSNNINVNFNVPKGGDVGSGLDNMYEGMGSGGYLSALLDKLTTAINKLNQNITRANNLSERAQTKAQANGSGGNFSSMFGSALGAAIGISVARVINNQADALMARASNAGAFMGSAIQGRANAGFGGYAARYYDIERQRQIANNRAVGEGASGVVGGLIGGFVGSLLDPIVGPAGTIGGASLGSSIGGAGGKYGADKAYNQYIEQRYQVAGALAKTLGDVSVSQWQTGFSRWGNKMTSTELVSGSLTGGAGINAPLSQDFINSITKKPGGITNLKDIQENIVPYMTQNPMGSGTDLNRLAQQFKQAGFAVSDFSKLTLQNAQYMAITGKNINQFGDDIYAARVKFGNGYGVDTNQTALNLMSGGLSQTRAQELAYQSQYNPNLMSQFSLLANSSYSDYMKRKALSGTVGFDINAALAGTGNISARVRNRYVSAIQQEESGKGYSRDLMLLMAATGETPQQLMGLFQKKVGTNNKRISPDPNLGPGQEAAFSAGTAGALLDNVGSMNVNAQVVNIVQASGNSGSSAVSTPAGVAGALTGNPVLNVLSPLLMQWNSLAISHSPAKTR